MARKTARTNDSEETPEERAPQSMRAKMRVVNVVTEGNQSQVGFSAVGDDKYGEDGESENNTFARYTPSASLNMLISNPNLVGTHRVGQEYYVDFTPVAQPGE